MPPFSFARLSTPSALLFFPLTLLAAVYSSCPIPFSHPPATSAAVMTSIRAARNFLLVREFLEWEREKEGVMKMRRERGEQVEGRSSIAGRLFLRPAAPPHTHTHTHAHHTTHSTDDGASPMAVNAARATASCSSRVDAILGERGGKR